MKERRRAWHAIISFKQHRPSDDFWQGMPSPPLDSTHGRMTSGVACHHRPWTAYTVGRRRAWHDIAVLGQHAWSDGVGQGMTSSPLGRTRSDYVGRGMTSSPLDSTHSRTTSCVACNHRLWAAHTIERRRAWHTIIAHGWQTLSNDVGRGMPSSPLGSTHGRMTSGVAFHHGPGHHTQSNNVGRGMTSPP